MEFLMRARVDVRFLVQCLSIQRSNPAQTKHRPRRAQDKHAPPFHLPQSRRDGHCDVLARPSYHSPRHDLISALLWSELLSNTQHDTQQGAVHDQA